MRTALYPGSFNPFHPGHADVLRQACMIFDIVLVCQMPNPHKIPPKKLTKEDVLRYPHLPNFDVVEHRGLMIQAMEEFKCDGVIRGIRTGYDVELEAKYVHWNREIGCTAPFFHILSAQHLAHISSSDIRAIGPELWAQVEKKYLLSQSTQE